MTAPPVHPAHTLASASAGVALLVAGSLLTLLATVSLWSWRTFASSEGFADVATDTLKEPAVAEVLADQIVDVLQDQVATAQAAVTVRPLLRQVVAEVVATEAFQRAVPRRV